MQGDSSRFDSNTVAFLNAKEKIFSNYFNESLKISCAITLHFCFKLILNMFSRKDAKLCLYADILNGYLNLSRATKIQNMAYMNCSQVSLFRSSPFVSVKIK